MSTRPSVEALGDATRGADPVLVVSAASRGFTVLLLGGVVQPWVGALSASLGYVWLALVALGAFALAAKPRVVRGIAPSAERLDRVTVAVAGALGSYALVLPLVLAAASEIPWTQLLCTAGTAVVVGVVVGALAPAPSA